ncbi:hypothetical protein D3C72_1841410 [compost metagenome]
MIPFRSPTAAPSADAPIVVAKAGAPRRIKDKLADHANAADWRPSEWIRTAAPSLETTSPLAASAATNPANTWGRFAVAPLV